MYVQKTKVLKPAEAKKKWYLIDAKDQVVGRLATEIVNILRGKNNPNYTPNTDSGDFLVVINASKVKFTGNKWNDKIYYSHSNYVGGLKETPAKDLMRKFPERVLFKAVKGMMPKTALSKKQLTKLKVYPGQEHQHEAQKPEVIFTK